MSWKDILKSDELTIKGILKYLKDNNIDIPKLEEGKKYNIINNPARDLVRLLEPHYDKIVADLSGGKQNLDMIWHDDLEEIIEEVWHRIHDANYVI